MREVLNPWTFVIAAYAIAGAAIAVTVGWSWFDMRRAEKRRDRSRKL